MMAFVPRFREILRRVSPETMASPMKRVEAFREPLLVVFLCGDLRSFVAQRRVMALFCGSLAEALIDFNLLKWCLRFFIHALTLLNLLPNCLRNLHSLCLKWFFGLNDGVLTSARGHIEAVVLLPSWLFL